MTELATPEAGFDLAELRLVPMRRRHLRGVLRIENQVYPRPWSMGLFLNEISGNKTDRIYLVARVGTTVIGYAGIMFLAGEGHIVNVAVDPAHQGRGIAARLLLELVSRARTEGIEAMTLEVRVSNEPAQRLYRRFGFAPAGVRPGYYQETGEDALIMWAYDVHTPDYAQRLRDIEAHVGPTAVEEDR